MITIDFIVDENVLADDLSADPANEDIAVLQETFFVFPTRLNINGTEMFGLSEKRLVMYGGQGPGEIVGKNQVIENSWISLPLLHLVFVGFGHIRRACEGTETTYSMPGTGAKLIFTPRGNNLEVRSTLNGNFEWIGCQELIEAVESYKHKVFHFIESRVPNMQYHPVWEWVIKA